MSNQQLLERITVDPKVMAGKPVIRGTRLTVEYILNLLAHGATVEDIIAEYDQLTREDVHACILFATEALKNTDTLWADGASFPVRCRGCASAASVPSRRRG